MGKASQRKGAAGERELAAILADAGYTTERGGFCFGEKPDLVGLPGIHIECKRVEHLNLYDAVGQSARDAREGELPAVFHRKNHCEWLVTMRLPDWVQIYGEFYFAPVNELEAELRE